MIESRIRRADRYQQIISDPIPSAEFSQKKKGMHWALALFFIAFLSGLFITSFQYFYEANYSWIVYRYNADMQTIFSIYYYSSILIWFLFRILWIRLTYKRYSYHGVWKTVTFIMIILSPFTYYVSTRNGLLLADVDISTINIYLTSVHLAVSYLIALIPLAYLFFMTNKLNKAKES